MSKYLPLNLFIRQALLYPLTSPFLPPESKVEKNYSYAAGKKTGTLPAGIPKTGQTHSQATGDDGNLQIGKPLTGPRFVDLGNNMAQEKASNLVYVKEPGAIGGDFGSAGTPTAMLWADANSKCYALTYQGHSDWRLPNISELYILIDHGRWNKAIDPLFTSVQQEYWSSTEYKNSGPLTWIVDFLAGYVKPLGGDVTYCYPRPVRGPI